VTISTWAEFESAAPELAAVAARLWPGITALHRGEPPPANCFSIAFLASVRPDGGPRLHPFCPVLAGGRLFAAIPRSSPKGSDLRRDPRCVIHALPGTEDDELCIRAQARDVTADQLTRELVRGVIASSGVGGMIQSTSHDPLFEFDLERVDVAKWLDIGQPVTRPVRQRWRST
jgi:Pyridoxamine 5'-phosphate oxidase